MYTTEKISRSIPNFWTFQIGGWLIYILYSLPQGWGLIKETRTGLLWISSIITLFLITVILRYLYLSIFNKVNSIYKFIYIAVLSSLISGFLWSLITRLLFFPFEGVAFKDSRFMGYFDSFPGIAFYTTLQNSWVFMLWSTLYFGIKNWLIMINEREKVLTASNLAQKAQMQMLRYQINPHFLFNSLNSIKALTHENPEQAAIMLTELSEFLRTTLTYDDKIFVSLEEEIELTKKYLHIEKIRFEERLNYKISLDENIPDWEVPCFITQPLVENAIKHGLTNNPKGVEISIKYSIENNSLIIEIINNSRSKTKDFSKGTGLNNIINRLNNAYNNKYKLTIENENDSFKVRLLIPENHDF